MFRGGDSDPRAMLTALREVCIVGVIQKDKQEDMANFPDDLMAYDDVCARIYADKRMTPGTRELALALAWVNKRDPERTNGGTLRRLGKLLGRDSVGRWRHKLLIAEDAPRYEPTDQNTWHSESCEGPRMRPYRPQGLSDYGKAIHLQKEAGKPLVCGANATICVVEHDMVTGWQRAHWFCRRHQAEAERVREQVASLGDPPPPIPNTGGLLPCYYKPEQVEKIYRWANPNWVAPYHGICADDWPTPGHNVIARRPRLALVADGDDALR